MPKKSKSLTVRGEIEILGPVQSTVPNLNAALERMVEQKIAEMMGDSHDGIFEPFFQAPAIAAAIRKLETVPQQHKWQYYFEEWGCMICESKDVGHFTLGMCAACFHRTRMRLQRILRRASEDRPEHAPARDLQDVAREALRAASGSDDSVLGAAGIPALEVETRPYVTRAERRARRKEMWRQAKALHDEKNLTWREIAQRLDPDFDKNPKAAIARIEMGAHRISRMLP